MRRVVRVWFSPSGAKADRPWCVQFDDGEVVRKAEVTITGTFESRYQPAGEPSLPDHPHIYLERKLDEQWRDDAQLEFTL